MWAKEFITKKQIKQNLILGGLLIGLLLSVIFALTIGSTPIQPLLIAKILISKIIEIDKNWPAYFESIIIGIRLPRVLLGLLVGAALGIAGCSMQGLFRNPMASPYVIGIASSSAFGASLAIVLGLNTNWIGPSAFLFSVSCAFLVYSIAKARARVSIATLLLAGIAISLFFSALVSFTQYVAGERELRQIVFWLMGGLWASSWNKVISLSPLIFLGSIGILFFSRELNILLTGEEQAQDLGVGVENVRKMVLVLASLVTAGAVAACGIIGFVGLIIPHIMRMLVGPDHRILLPSSFLGGAIFLVWTDALARKIIAPSELPVGIITAILGVPFFLFLLRRRKKMIGF
ncbi:MAG: iron chelate uptake ABC transporter family permease subunit [Candidatus Omnitrophica bacterium]|nr:iron chelate uptake ABC transporter family permease subunit [Candidatus Omnitrophota bacterium]